MVLMSMSSSISIISGAYRNLSLIEKCKPHLDPSTSQDQPLVLAGLTFFDSKDHHHQVVVTSYVCSSKAACRMDVNS